MSGATPDVIWIDGQPAQAVSVLDRGLHYGDGLFETIACRHGRARFLEFHLERLASGCRRLGLDPGDIEVIGAEVRALAGEVHAAIVKVIVTRGTATTRGYAPAADARATRIVLRYEWPPGSLAAEARVGIASLRLGENPALAGMKHLNRLEQVLAQAERVHRQVDELLLLSSSGRLISATMANVFLVRQGALLTPRIDLCGVAGILRRVVLDEARRVGLMVSEAELTMADAEEAEEIFLTNARVGVWPAASLESRRLGTGPVTRRLQEALAPLLMEAVDG